MHVLSANLCPDIQEAVREAQLLVHVGPHTCGSDDTCGDDVVLGQQLALITCRGLSSRRGGFGSRCAGVGGGAALK